MSDNFEMLKEAYNKKFATDYPFRLNSTMNWQDTGWIKIGKRTKVKDNLLPYVVAINEMFRFDVGSTQPEYKVGEEYLITKKVDQGDEVGKDKIKTLYALRHEFLNGKNTFWEGMGRVVFAKYFYQEDDFNIYNALIDKNNYFVGLDPNRCLWTVTAKYHDEAFQNVKVVYQNNTPFPVVAAKSNGGTPIYIIKGKKRDFIGDMHAEDYQRLPQIKHYYPLHWFFLLPELRDYSYALSKNKRFLNEKHFMTLKVLTTIAVKKLMLEIHVADERDRKDAENLLNEQWQKLMVICQGSSAFKNYLVEHRLIAMQVILYEIDKFFNENSSYQLSEYPVKKIVKKDAVHRFADILREIEIEALSESEAALLNEGVEDIAFPQLERVAYEFYTQQAMHYHAGLIKS